MATHIVGSNCDADDKGSMETPALQEPSLLVSGYILLLTSLCPCSKNHCIHFYLMQMGVLPSCMDVHHIHAEPMEARTKSVSDPLELELQMVVSNHVGAGNQTQIWERSECSASEPTLHTQTRSHSEDDRSEGGRGGYACPCGKTHKS